MPKKSDAYKHNKTVNTIAMVQPKDVTVPSGRRQWLGRIVEGKTVVRFITLLIIINAITLGVETDPTIFEDYDELLIAVDKIILVIFTFELIAKFFVYRGDFFRSGWNTFDFLVVGVSWIPAVGAFSILRAFRILRVFRLFSVVPQMRRVLSALMLSIPGMLSVIGILSLIFYVCAVLATTLFGTNQDPQMQEWFGSIAASLYTMFQIMTLESWSMGIVRPTMEIFPLSWVFFVPFIIVTSFAVLNLFIGIIVDAMQSAQHEPRQTDKTELKDFTHQEVQSLHQQIDQLQSDLALIKNHLGVSKRRDG